VRVRARTLSVLVADDLADTRFLVRRFLERSGRFTVVAEAANGVEAVAMVARYTPDLALLDLVMPVMDGLEALPLVRQASPQTRVIVLSDLAREWLSDEHRGGAAAVLEKNLDPEAFVRELLSVIDQTNSAPYASLALAGTLIAPKTAREFVRVTLADWDYGEVIDDAILLTSELVTNAVLHAESDLEVRVSLREGIVRVEVLDDSPGGLIRRQQSANATAGRGLAMVNTLAVLWGSDPIGDGKSVWFELPLGARR
jgi:CheY-like chemotaxis protein